VITRGFDDAEVDQCEPLRAAELDLVDRPLPRLEVDLGRRRDRDDVTARYDADACRVARIEGAVRGEVADVVIRVARRGEAPQRVSNSSP
jgi:hypothetical protein